MKTTTNRLHEHQQARHQLDRTVVHHRYGKIFIFIRWMHEIVFDFSFFRFTACIFASFLSRFRQLHTTKCNCRGHCSLVDTLKWFIMVPHRFEWTWTIRAKSLQSNNRRPPRCNHQFDYLLVKYPWRFRLIILFNNFLYKNHLNQRDRRIQCILWTAHPSANVSRHRFT